MSMQNLKAEEIEHIAVRRVKAKMGLFKSSITGHQMRERMIAKERSAQMESKQA